MTAVDPSVDPGAQARAALHIWRDCLIDLSCTSRLLNFQPAKGGLVEIASPSPEGLVKALQRGEECPFRGAGATGGTPGPGSKGDAGADLFPAEAPDRLVVSMLRRLRKKARQEYLDRGVQVLHLAVETVHWRDDEDCAYASPLLLMPVTLSSIGPGEVPRISPGDGDPVLNPALTVRLRELGVDAPVLDPSAEVDLPLIRARFQSAIACRPGWHLTHDAILSCFSFHKEAMYRDLIDNEERILDHPVVRALAATGHRSRAAGFDFPPITAAQIDELAPPEDVPFVLDADASQRAAVAAALAGRSFVLDGPPGTGKSQTIANMIGCLLHAGRRILFVSEKAAALEVVRNRLAAVGLDAYLLELHSHQAGRKEVATALAAACERLPPGVAATAGTDHGVLREHREQLTAYAVAMNEVREPLGMSLHDALGECARLVDVPAAPVPMIAPAALTPAAVRQIDGAADRLSRAWPAVTAPAAFPWRGVIVREPLDEVLGRAQRALARLAESVRLNAAVAAAFDLRRPNRARVLSALVAHAARRPPEVRDEWLTAVGLQPAEQELAELTRGLAAVRRAREAVQAQAGVAWSALPPQAPLTAAPELTPPAVELGPLTAATADGLARRFAEDAGRLDRHRQTIDQVTTRLGVPTVVTFPDLCRAVAIVELGGRPNRPEPFWFGAGVLPAVSTGAATLRRCLESLVAVEVRARPYFTEAILGQPVDQLAARFAGTHRGLRKLLGAYRRDKRAVAAFVLPTTNPAEAVARLGTAVAWKQAMAGLAAAEHTYALVLGRYWRGVGTDFRALDQAVQVAAEVLRWTPPAMLRAVVEYVCAAEADTDLIRLATAARDDVLAWQAALRPAPLPAARPELAAGAVDAAIAWLRAQVEPLRAVARSARAFGDATGRDLDHAEVVRLAQLRQAVVDAEAALTAGTGRDFALLSRGAGPDDELPVAALGWASAARRLATGADQAFSAEQARALGESRPDGALPALIEAWDEARAAVLAAFAPDRRAGLAADLDDYQRAERLLRELRDDAAGQEEWFDQLAARDLLAGFGLDTAVEFAAGQGLDADEVRGVVRRALFRSWADAVIRADTRLRPARAGERDRLVARFRRLDARRVAAAPGQVIEAVEAGRPDEAAAAEELGLLLREAMKVTGHLPVRELIGRARDTVLALKPCFLMSPVAVSQFLPPDLSFDVVIFDEASQVTPADAIACVYRARALIVAGDDKQLPPTSFFDRMLHTDDERAAETDVTDFQSVLELAKACGAFRHLGLTWHYRSRHESLIAFSNQHFYQGRLTTFPSANGEGPDAGIEVFHVRGVYRRSAGRDNPVEAGRVAERILHHFTTRPDQSLGVVTFSVAQAEAIERAVADRPELDPHADDDRLHGFFVKSLESVQGDERDVMIFSIGYGFDEAGKINTNFGPLNRPNGWRRLNVAITRARRRVELVTSIRSRDIPATDNEGVRRLAAYLDFAERGTSAPPGPAEQSGAPFEESVLATIRSWGYEVRTNVGASGRRIDLGVRHPAYAGEVYALAVQCDGASYHAFATARDRDRLQDQVLRGLGWKLHRVWSVAWHRDRAEEESRLRTAIEQAVGAAVDGRPPGPVPVAPPAFELPPTELSSTELSSSRLPPNESESHTAEVLPVPGAVVS
ncbi:DUF4011 domain-containing protein [Micromonosporaceae bacterium Da 78-11]